MVPTSIFAGGEKVAAMWELYKISIAKFDCHEGGFHLHLLVFPFVYQFNSRIGVLVNSSFAND